MIVYCNVPAFKEWPTIFKLLFQALHSTVLVTNLQIMETHVNMNHYICVRQP